MNPDRLLPRARPGVTSQGRLLLWTAFGCAAFAAGRWSAPDKTPWRPTPAAIGSTAPAVASPPPRPPNVTDEKSMREKPAAPTWDDGEWARLLASPGSMARNAELAARLEQLAQTDPARALSLASGQRNLLLRDSLVKAVLRGWSDAAPADAARWAQTLDDATKRGAALETVFGRVATKHPEEALRLGRTIFQQDPGGASGHARALAEALCSAGRFDMAARLADAPGDLGSVERSILTAQTYLSWSRFQPEEAARTAASLTDPAARQDALNAVVGGWGQTDPAGLTDYMARLSDGPGRIQMLGQSLRQWASLDPDAATAWVANNNAGLGVDDGVAAVAGAGFLKPELAAEWAAGIESPSLRSQTMLTLLRTWVNEDPDASRRYFEQTPFLSPEDRIQAATFFAPPSGS